MSSRGKGQDSDYTEGRVILPFTTVVVKGPSKLTMYSKHRNVTCEPILGYLNYIAMTRSCVMLRPGVCKVDVYLWNHKQINLPKETSVGDISTTNGIPALLAMKPTENNEGARITTKQKQMEGQRQLFDKFDLTGLWDWSLEDQKGCRIS